MNDRERIGISGTKTWNDGGLGGHDNETDITLALQRKLITETDDATANWQTVVATPEWSGDTYSYTGLDKYNEAGVEYVYRVRETDMPSGYEASYNGNDIVNTLTDVKGEFGIIKYDENGEGPANVLGGVTFTLYGWDGASTTGVVGVPQTTGATGSAEFKGIAPGTYKLRETGAPPQYDLSAMEWTIVVVDNEDGTATTRATDGPRITSAQEIDLTDVLEIVNDQLIEDPQIHKDVEEKPKLVLSEMREFVWNIVVPFGTGTSSWKSAVIEDEFESVLLINEAGITIVDETEAEVPTSRYTLGIAGKTLTLTLLADADGYGYLSGKTYKISVPTQIDPEADLSGYWVESEDETQIPNEARFTYGLSDDPKFKTSDKPVVVPPEKEPEIHKDVEELSKLVLSELREFVWNIVVPFGTGTSGWESAVIEDEFEPVLIINEAGITVVDEADDVVPESLYELVVVDQKLTLTLLADADGYGYLSGKTYKISVPTEIDPIADLSGYLVESEDETQIPNQAKLTYKFENESDLKTKDSETPVVVPPEPEIKKDVEGQPKLVLTGPREFVWNIVVPFGAGTSSWETAVITD